MATAGAGGTDEAGAQSQGSAEDCIICSEQLRVPATSLTRCGHVFHTGCIERWFVQKPLCPLCKTRSTGEGFTRILRPPAALDALEVERMRTLAARDSSSTGAAAMAKRLRADAERCAHEISVAAEARQAEADQLRHKRREIHQLESAVLKLRKELSAAERIEAETAAAVAAEGAENEPPLQSLPPQLDAQRSVSREAVAQQSRQLAWRCQEIRELDEKLAAATRDTAASRPRI
jgi:hypothetical protein